MSSLLHTKRLCEQPVWYLSGTLPLSLAALTATAQTEQRKLLVGGATVLQRASGYSTGPVAGLHYEHRFTHSRFETGIRYRGYDLQSGYLGRRSSTCHFFALPLPYKYSSNVINVAVGPTFNLLNDKNGKDTLFSPLQKRIGQVALGYQFKVGKTINLTERLVPAPEVSVPGDQYFRTPEAEVNVGFTYRF